MDLIERNLNFDSHFYTLEYSENITSQYMVATEHSFLESSEMFWLQSNLLILKLINILSIWLRTWNRSKWTRIRPFNMSNTRSFSFLLVHFFQSNGSIRSLSPQAKFQICNVTNKLVIML